MKNRIWTLLLCAAFLSCEKEKKQPAPVKIPTEAELKKQADSQKRAEVVAYAKKYLGTKYCYAGSTPEGGFDCSGFVNFVYKNFGIELPRSSPGFADLGTPLKPEDFRVG
ncbi:MAG TPA: NlpC/P60 family protein, partial [Flavobacterium sp.]|nr:NlpC/P60 family protein [Flavobacterium sp.]